MMGCSEKPEGPYIDRKSVHINLGGGTTVLEGDKNWNGVRNNAVIKLMELIILYFMDKMRKIISDQNSGSKKYGLITGWSFSEIAIKQELLKGVKEIFGEKLRPLFCSLRVSLLNFKSDRCKRSFSLPFTGNTYCAFMAFEYCFAIIQSHATA